MSTSLNRRFLACLAALLCLSGCDKDKSSTPSVAESSTSENATTVAVAEPTVLEPCTLISHERIEEIVGSAIAIPEPSAEPMGSATFYGCSSDDIHIDVQVWDTALNAASMFDLGTEHPPIDGIGDRAKNTQPLGEIEILVGRYVVGVNLFTSLDSDTELEAAKKIASIVVDNLP